MRESKRQKPIQEFSTWVDHMTGYECHIWNHPESGVCGYVSIPQDHPCYMIDVEDLSDIAEWGGFRPYLPNRYWIGNAWQEADEYIPGFKVPGLTADVRYIEHVVTDCQRLAAKLKKERYSRDYATRAFSLKIPLRGKYLSCYRDKLGYILRITCQIPPRRYRYAKNCN